MKKLLLIAAVVSGLLIAASPFNYFQERYLLRLEKNARDSAYTLAQAYTTTALSSYSGSSPFFTTGVQFTDTLFCYSSDSTDTSLIFWQNDTLWLSLNNGVARIPALSGFASTTRVDTLEDSVNFLLAKVDTLQTICDSLGGLAGGSGDSIPPGAIMLWSGAANKIPAGWCLCDSINNVDTFAVSWAGDTLQPPNLSNLFVVSYGSKYAVNSKGGADSVASAGTTDAGSAHTHAINGLVADSTVRYPGTGTKIYIGRLSTGTTLPTNANESAHTHTFTAAKETNIPPYYALCYIFKL